MSVKEHEANRASWDTAVNWWREKEDARGKWMKAHRDPALVLCSTEMEFVKDISGRSACVLGSGDNEVAFALAGLGANVTSVDISQERLDVAAERAKSLGLELTFVRADVTDLSEIADESFNLVYTGGHVAVWVSDIKKYYSEAARVLKKDGAFVVNEYHPVRRMWLEADSDEPRHRYFNRGPYEYTSDEGLPTFEYHWTVADHIQAVIDGGCSVVRVEEYGETVENEYWTEANLNGLPANLLIVGRK